LAHRSSDCGAGEKERPDEEHQERSRMEEKGGERRERRGKGRDSYLGGIGAGSRAPGAGRRDGAVSATGSEGTSRLQRRAGRTGAA